MIDPSHNKISFSGTYQQTCRHLHLLAFTKYVWLTLLQDAEARLFLDRWPESPLHQFSTTELIGLAKRMVQGPQTWSHSHSSGPLIARQKVLHPQIYLGPGVLEWENEPKLLSGGQYVLFNSRRVLECWSVAEDRLIWKHQSQWEFANVLQFAAEVVDDGRAAVILIGLRTTNDIDMREKCVSHLSQSDVLTYAYSTALWRLYAWISFRKPPNPSSLNKSRTPTTIIRSFVQ